MTCLHCESPNIAIQTSEGFYCSRECCTFYQKTKKNELMDKIIQSSKKLLILSPNAVELQMNRMLRARMLLANQIKIGDLVLIQRMRSKFLEIIGELSETVRDLVIRSKMDEETYLNLCNLMKKSLSMFDSAIKLNP